MSVIFFWRWDNYSKDMKTGKAYYLSQNSELIFKLQIGQHIWAIIRVGHTYVLAADLVVIRTQLNPTGYKYGKYRALADKHSSRYFNVYNGLDIEPTIRSLSFSPQAEPLGWSFRGKNGVRLLTPVDEQRLITFSFGLQTI